MPDIAARHRKLLRDLLLGACPRISSRDFEALSASVPECLQRESAYGADLSGGHILTWLRDRDHGMPIVLAALGDPPSAKVKARRIGRPRLSPEERTKQITICLPQWLVDALTDEARESGASVSRVIRADLERTRWWNDRAP